MDVKKYGNPMEMLKLRERQYKEILDNMYDEVSCEDKNGTVIYVNKAYCKYYGISKEDAIGRKGTDVVIPEDRHKYDLIKTLTTEQPTYTLDVRVKKADGSIAWIQETGKAFFDTSGELIEVQEVGHDFTLMKSKQEKIEGEKEALEAGILEKNAELMEANEKLIEVNEYLDSILQNISDGVAVVNESGKLERTNMVLEKTWGDLLPAIEKNFKKTIEEDKDSPITKMIKEGKSFENYELIISTKGKPLRCMVSGSPLSKSIHRKSKTGVVVIESIEDVHKLVNRISGFQARFTFENIIGNSKKMVEAVETAKKVAKSQASVLIEGESGTGKELFAQAIHNHSKREKGPFIAINCGAIPNELIESELFGYEEGAFTGGKKGGKPGKFELASGGTVFLDEIGEMPLPHQVALLRVIQEKKVVRVGGEREIPVDIRIISATNKELEMQVEKGNFRQDLFYRLNVINLKVPSLRERAEDIPLLVEHFLKDVGFNDLGEKMFNENIMGHLKQYDWPGNVRELQNLVEKSVYLSRDKETLREILPYVINNKKENNKNFPMEERRTESFYVNFEQYKKRYLSEMEKREKEYILSLMDLFEGNLSQVSRKMGIARNTLYRKMDKYKLK
ncbi:MAG: sigma 54-interacting transcriptional regulator [Anaerovoracaceae bacterium]